MFKNDFQGGHYFEVFSAQSKDPVAGWKIIGQGVKRHFDKHVKSFIYSVEGSTVANKMQLPKDSKGSLILIQRFLILQLFVPKGQDFSIDLGVSDMSNQKRRLVFSTTYKETQTNPLHSKIPIGYIKRAKWLNLCLDLLSLVGENWTNQTYKCIDSLCISGNCKLRRIFTMKHQPPDTTDDDELYGCTGTNSVTDIESIPKQCQLSADIPQDVQVVTMNKVRYFEGRGKPVEPLTSRTTSQPDLDLNSSGGKKSGSLDAYHIAFGTKVSGSQPRKGSGKEGSSTNRQPKPTHTRSQSDASVDASQSGRFLLPPARSDRLPTETSRREKPESSPRERKNSDPGTNTEDPEVAVDKDSLRTSHTWTDGADNKESIPFVKPHPPRQPSSEKRRKPRVKSAGKERTPHQQNRDESSMSSSAYSSMNSNHSQCASRSNSGNKSTRTTYQQPQIVANDDEVERIMRDMFGEGRKSETESEPSSHNTSGAVEGDDSISDVIQTLAGQDLDSEGADNTGQEYEDSDGDNEETSNSHKLFIFSSKPKQVTRGDTLAQSTTKLKRSHRKKESTETNHRQSHTQHDMPTLSCSNSLTNSSDEDDDTQITPRPSKPTRPSKRATSPKARKNNNHKSKHSDYSANNGLLQIAPVPTKSPYNSQTRRSISKKSLREIPRESIRKSGGQKVYDPNIYVMAELSDSFEANMLAQMKQDQMEDDMSSDEQPIKSPRSHQQQSHLHHNMVDLSSSSDEMMSDTSTLKQATLRPSSHNYQAEMEILSQEFLTQSNPRVWGNVLSPPIVVPSMQNGTGVTKDDLTAAKLDVSPKAGDTDGEEELDLLFDPLLGCYYDPKTCKYYELV